MISFHPRMILTSTFFHPEAFLCLWACFDLRWWYSLSVWGAKSGLSKRRQESKQLWKGRTVKTLSYLILAWPLFTFILSCLSLGPLSPTGVCYGPSWLSVIRSGMALTKVYEASSQGDSSLSHWDCLSWRPEPRRESWPLEALRLIGSLKGSLWNVR